MKGYTVKSVIVVLFVYKKRYFIILSDPFETCDIIVFVICAGFLNGKVGKLRYPFD